MKINTGKISNLVDASEMTELKDLVDDDRVIGYSVIDDAGEAIDSEGVSETAIAVFTNIFEHTEKIGEELGETSPRPTIMFTGREMEVTALPLKGASALVVKEKGGGLRR